MRAFLAVRHSRDPKQFHGDLWAQNFVPALQDLGHEVVEARTNLVTASKFMHIAGNFTPQELAERGRLTELLLKELKSAHEVRPLQLFLSYFRNSHFDPAAFPEIERLGITCVNFDPGGPFQFSQVKDIAGQVQWSWHTERDSHKQYQMAGARPLWLQVGADPRVYCAMPVDRREPMTCYLGSRYADRNRWLVGLLDRRVPLAIYGSGWQPQLRTTVPELPTTYLGRRSVATPPEGELWANLKVNLARFGPLAGLTRTWRQQRFHSQTQAFAGRIASLAKGTLPFDQPAAALFARHDVILNLSNVWADGEVGSALVPHVRLRDFEAPLCRTCYLTGHTDEIGEYYKLGEEIETYRTVDELADKIRFYLREPAKAESLREAGHLRASRDHTWTQRFKQLFSLIGLATS